MMNFTPWLTSALAPAAAPSAVYLPSNAETVTRHFSLPTCNPPSALYSAATRSTAPLRARPHWAAGPERVPTTPSFNSQAACAWPAIKPVTLRTNPPITALQITALHKYRDVSFTASSLNIFLLNVFRNSVSIDRLHPL